MLRSRREDPLPDYLEISFYAVTSDPLSKRFTTTLQSSLQKCTVCLKPVITFVSNKIVRQRNTAKIWPGEWGAVNISCEVDSSVGIATGYGLDEQRGREFESR
jgi:hypothetical protein